MIKFLTPWGIKCVRGDQMVTQSCYMVNILVIHPQEIKEIYKVKELDGVCIDPSDQEKKMFVGTNLLTELKKELVKFLTEHNLAFT